MKGFKQILSKEEQKDIEQRFNDFICNLQSDYFNVQPEVLNAEVQKRLDEANEINKLVAYMFEKW